MNWRVKKMLRSSAAAAAVTLVLAILVSAGFPFPGQNEAPKFEPRRDAHVIVVSIDGLVPEYYTAPGPLGLRVPNLIRMKLDGAYADGVEGVYPSVTYPAHTTMVTGVRPALHGIINNRVFEPPTEPQTRSWYWFADALKSPTLWVLAKQAGLVTAAVGWPVTVGAEIDQNFPEIWDPAEKPLTAKRAVQYTTPGLLAGALGAGLGPDTSTDGRRTAVSEYIIKKHKPNLMLIHLVDLDAVHHSSGPRSDEALKVAEREDAYLGRIIGAAREAGILARTTILVVSDHGFADVEKVFEPNVVLVKEKLITLDSEGKPVAWKAAAWPSGGSAAIMLRDPADAANAARVADIFGQVARRDNGPLNRVLGRSDLDRLAAVPGALLMLEAAPGYSLDEKLTGPDIHDSPNYRGTHGQLPTRVEMRSSLVMYGAGVRQGARVPLARMIDIAPTAAALLGLRFDKAEGVAIEDLLSPAGVPSANR